MTFNYYLPDENSNKKEYHTSNNSIVIIGANGSGKSKLGAWIELQDMRKVHRIGGQRNLNFSKNIEVKPYPNATDFLFYGTDDKGQQASKPFRWNWGRSYTTQLIDDFNYVLAALIALKNNENDQFIRAYKLAFSTESRPEPPNTVIDKLLEIWDGIFPQRKLKLENDTFFAFSPDKPNETYHSNEMSDGERAALYLIVQVLCVPKEKYLIIDEPEIHIHRSILIQLWEKLEQYRPDCFFIYITHDTEFAASHLQSDKIWVKEYKDNKWNLERITEHKLPEKLLFDILGSRKDILFVEGESNSYDAKLYAILYPSYYIIPCGSCEQVISRTKAFTNTPSLHHCRVYGIIDRDYRSNEEISQLSKHNVFALEVAEIENLFLTEGVILSVANHLGKEEPERIFSHIRNFVLKRFSEHIEKQICKSTVANLKFKLSSIELSTKSKDDVQLSFNNSLQQFNTERILAEQNKIFTEALNTNNYKKILKLFNEKGLSKSVGQYFGLTNGEYCAHVLNFLKKNKCPQISEAFLEYMPPQIPRSSDKQ